MLKTKIQKNQLPPPALSVTILRGETEKKQYEFDSSFQIGRDEACQIRFDDGIVSRIHAEVKPENNHWWFNDLNSTNGTFVNGQRTNRVQIVEDMQIELGVDGPVILFKLHQPEQITSDSPSVTRYVEHFFDDKKEKTEIGEHTRMIREAYTRVQKKVTLKYYKIIGVVVFLLIFAGSYAIYQNKKMSAQKKLGEEIFYNMKSLELQLAQLQQSISLTNDTKSAEQIKQYNASKADMEKNYDKFVTELGIYKDMDETEQLILKMARLFGECELNVPAEFITEVKKYIKNWQSTQRLTRAIQRAKDKGCPDIIVQKMLDQHLPPQFFYLALQESNFNPQIVGPPTRYGYAKGIWQFIPQTALQYGLKTGPLVQINKYDPRDERFNFEKATDAASRYLSDIYNTEAQASGLLVIASYNWGENNVRNLIAQLPANPRERNFWKLLEKYKNRFPSETYNYVFYIFSAAVIGENPGMFGFGFRNPLKRVVEQITY